MDIAVYLPDELGRRAKAKPVNLSRVLRDALVAQFEEEDAVSQTLAGAEVVTLDLEDEEGRAYKGRLEATLIAEGPKGEAVYLRANRDVFLYNPDEQKFWTLGDPAEDLRALLDQTEYMGAMESLGIVPEIDLDAK